MDAARSVVLVVPIVPAPSGNGLAMRARMLLDALTPVADVHVVVVPVSGPSTDVSWPAARAASVTILEPVGPQDGRRHTTAQLADEDLRARLERTAPLPDRVVAAPPTLAETAVVALDGMDPPDAVLAMRAYLAPLGIHLAHRLDAARVVVDADDDDVALLRAAGDADEADRFERLLECWLPEADAVLAASPVDAAGITDRLGIPPVDVVPNVISPPVPVGPPPGADRVLFVGNLTYEPNRVAVRVLAGEVLPRLRERRPTATVELVGLHAATLDDVDALDGVTLTGVVPDVAPHYAAADVVVVPLRHGGGTRIKVLEAFAYRRPVVATPTAVAGLDVEHGVHALIVESPADLADAVDRVLADPAGVADMVERAAELAATRYSPAAVAPLVHAAVLGTAGARVSP